MLKEIIKWTEILMSSNNFNDKKLLEVLSIDEIFLLGTQSNIHESVLQEHRVVILLFVYHKNFYNVL